MNHAQALAQKLDALLNCIKSDNTVWQEKHVDAIESIMESAPSGSGIDCGTKLDIEKSHGNKLVFYASYHHMDEGGYDGWTEHTIVVNPHLYHGFTLRVSGRNRNDIKDYLHEVYSCWLAEEYS